MDYNWVNDMAERAVSTFAQATLTALGGDLVNVWNVDWRTVLGFGLGAAGLSVLKSLAARRVGAGTASLVDNKWNN